MTDPIADMIIRIKNALLARHPMVLVPHSKVKQAIAQVLVDHGYVESVDLLQKQPQSDLQIKLKYVARKPAITDVKRVSKPGRRVYSPADTLPRSLGGYGITIISTNQGVMTDAQARKQNVGGEVLCQIW
jgi:small subunit ribosomal protein S8